MNQIISDLDTNWHGKSKRQHVKEFACVFSILFSLFIAYDFYHSKITTRSIVLLILIAAMLVSGYKKPEILKPIWALWMKFAGLLGAVMTALIVSVAWFLMLVPVALCLKLFKKSSMDLSFDKTKETYWVTREPESADFKLLERQY